MLDILNYVDSHIDVEDLSECVESGEESEKFTALMAFMDSIMEDCYRYSLVCCPGVLQAKRHKPITDGSPLCDERCLLLIRVHTLECNCIH